MHLFFPSRRAQAEAAVGAARGARWRLLAKGNRQIAALIEALAAAGRK